MVYVYPLRPSVAVWQRVIDITAEANGWPDVRGVVTEIDGSNVKVKYDSGAERWKMHINVREYSDEIPEIPPTSA